MQYVNFLNRRIIHEFIISLWPDLPHEMYMTCEFVLLFYGNQDFTETLNTRTEILFLFFK